MSTKANIAVQLSGVISPDTYNFEVTDPSLFLTVVVDGLTEGAINVRRRDRAGTGWEPLTDGRGPVQLNRENTSVTPLKPGIYGLEGAVGVPVDIFTEAM